MKGRGSCKVAIGEGLMREKVKVKQTRIEIDKERKR